MHLNKEAIEKMYRHALKEYPDDCCGIVTGDERNQTVHFCRNIQNRLHAEDPERYPGDAKTAYFIDRSEFNRIISSAKEQAHDIIAFYHSHTDHEAYFSATDVEVQTVFGEPEFPDAVHIVVSIMDGRAHDIKGYKWDKDKRDFAAAGI